MREAQLHSLPGVYHDLENITEDELSDTELENLMTDNPQVFGGDFFGSDYGPHDFPGFEDAVHGEGDGDESDDETANIDNANHL